MWTLGSDPDDNRNFVVSGAATPQCEAGASQNDVRKKNKTQHERPFSPLSVNSPLSSTATTPQILLTDMLVGKS